MRRSSATLAPEATARISRVFACATRERFTRDPWFMMRTSLLIQVGDSGLGILYVFEHELPKWADTAASISPSATRPPVRRSADRTRRRRIPAPRHVGFFPL